MRRARNGYVMFLRTVMCGHNAYDWKTIPMLRLSGDRFTRRLASNTAVSPNEMRPALGVSSPARQRSVVIDSLRRRLTVEVLVETFNANVRHVITSEERMVA